MSDIEPRSEKLATDVDVQELPTDLSEHLDKGDDVAGRYIAAIGQRPDGAELLAPWTAAEEKAVVRKADLIIVPLLSFALTMGATDKVAIGTASVMGIRTDLGMNGNQYSWASAITYFGQLATVFPALFFFQRLPPATVFSVNVIIWGVISMCTAACQNYRDLYAVRFILGFFESITFTATSLLLTSWYTRSEQVYRVGICYNTISSLINGLISYGAIHVKHFTSWRVQYICVGGITFVLGCLMLALLPNSPTTARWLTERQRVIATQRLSKNRTGVENKVYKLYQVKEAVLDLRTWLIFLINLCLSIPNSGIGTFNSIIINSLGFSVSNTLLLNVPTGFISWFGALIAAYIAYKTQQRCFTAIGFALIPIIATIVLTTVPRANVSGSLAGVYLVYMYWAPYVVCLTLVNANTGGYTKKTTVYGISYCGYLVGNLIGPKTFLAKEAPKYHSGIIAFLVSYCVGIALILCYYFTVVALNRSKERYLAAHPDEAQQHTMLDEWHDKTDKENVRFRYIY